MGAARHAAAAHARPACTTTGNTFFALLAFSLSLILALKSFASTPSSAPAPIYYETMSFAAAAAPPAVPPPPQQQQQQQQPRQASRLAAPPPLLAPAALAPPLAPPPPAAAPPLPPAAAPPPPPPAAAPPPPAAAPPPLPPAAAPQLPPAAAPPSSPRCRLPGTASAAGARLTGLPTCLETGATYTALLEGARACAGGGDYWELLLMGPRYLARAPSADAGNGSHAVTVHLPHLATGLLAGAEYTLFAHLLFEGGAGLGGEGVDWKEEKMLGLEDAVTLKVNVRGPGECSSSSSSGAPAPAPTPAPDGPCPTLVTAAQPPPAPWRGFWLRDTGDLTQPCAPPFCVAGSAPIAAAMPDNAEGWVYRLPGCAFRLHTAARARACLGAAAGGDGAHLLALGDSTMQDSVRNLLTDGLGVAGSLFMEDGQFLPRRANFTRRSFPAVPPLPALHNFSLTLEFAGAPNAAKGGEGVRTYSDAPWRARLGARLAALPPTLLWVNDAGLHSAQWAADLGPGGLGLVREAVRSSVLPLWLAPGPRALVYRTSVCPALEHRSHKGNPQSMEAHNAIVVAELHSALVDLAAGAAAQGGDLTGGGRGAAPPPPAVHVIDFFDMTFAWHLHPCCSDGGHFGRPPYYKFWRNGAVYTGANNLGVGEGFSMVSALHYVDNFLHQVFLGAVCPE